jgi:pimeloyl-ACP methyl ester carboxylesterase
MSEIESMSGLAAINNANIYYEVAGRGEPFVMIHAGVADSRQWNNEFIHFADRFRVVRYDMRGYGKSEPVDGEYSNLQDLAELIDYLHLEQPIILMGCSMGGGLALDFTLTYPTKVKALIMVDSGPSGLELDAAEPTTEFEEAEKAYNAGNLDRAAEIETHIWFDGMGRSSKQVNQVMRQLAYEMDRNALALQNKRLGKRNPDLQTNSVDRLDELKVPVLVIVGNLDLPYMLAAADYMVEKIPSSQKMIIQDAAHLPNMDHPDEFQRVVDTFLESVVSNK